MYMEGLLFIGPIPLHVAGVSEQNQRTYFEDHQTPVAPVFPTMLVKVKAGGGYSKASTDLVDTYMREMAEYTSLLNVLNSLPRRPQPSGPPAFICIDPSSLEAEYILKMGGMVAEGIEAILSPELKGEDQLRAMCATNATELDLQQLWLALKSMHTGNNERAYEDLLNRVEALMLTGGDEHLETFLLQLHGFVVR